ncbi:uncharacterized protein Dana_GF15586, isoform B [Drosophila ananassae]|uniref:Uncharacterized protein, isoform B n=1 Tax=Drosophila ananassae TaxID=7217 RepID=A0A0P8Y476_DROAN|nr:procyclic form-specific polypeptide B1-alpha isoform X2 [Drosophila ananassae]KPU73706.1 uncharacterized protein Dana_GF15586, isoform B [Drosophila ananassae]
MKLITVLAFACATFAVLHGVYGSPVPAPVPDPSPVADPKPKAEPSPDPEPVPHPNPNPNPNPALVASPLETKLNPALQGGDANVVALSPNADPLVSAPGAPGQKIEETLAV